MNLLELFASPLFLLLLVPGVALVLFLSRKSLAGLSPPRRWTSILLRTLVVAFLVLALAESRLLWKNDRLAVIFLVDNSASIPAEHRRAALEFVNRASQHLDRERGDQVGCVVFGKNAGIEASARPERLKIQDISVLIERDFTDLQAAIRLALAAFPEGCGKRLVLISDGNENQGNALEEARRALSDGATIDTLSIRYDYPAEILIDKLVVDPEVHIGEPFDVRVVAESTRETDAVLRLFQNKELVQSQTVHLKAGKTVFTVPQRLELSRFYEYEAMIEPLHPEEDAVIQNNGATGFTIIRGLPRVLLCSDDPGLDEPLQRALAGERINSDVVRPEALPVEPNAYLQYDAVIFSNVAAHQVTQSQMKLMENLVKGAGIGFLMIGGENSFGAGGYLSTPIEELLPVSMDVKQKKNLPNGALAIVMHSCEIGNGNYWAKVTVQQAIETLSSADFAGVLYYGGTGMETWLFPMTRCDQKERMIASLKSFNVGDMPDFQRIIAMAHTGLKTTPASIKHIIIFSDGDPNMPTAGQIAAIRNDRITISTICMGDHSAQYVSLMRQLAVDGGGNFYRLTSAEGLPGIFIREAVNVRKALVQEKDFQPLVSRGGSFLAGVDLDAMPILKGYVVTTHKEQADRFITAPPAEDDPILDPILSSWQYGLGKSVAFTSDAGRRWGVHWTSWDSYQKLWGQMVRWVSRVQTDDRIRITQEREGDTGIITIDALDASGNFINDIDFEGTVVSPDFRSAAVEVRQIASGRFEARFPVGKSGTYLLTLKYLKDGQPAVYSTGMTLPYSPEYRQLQTNDALLGDIANAASGKVLDGLADEGEQMQAIFRRDFPASRTPQDLWRDLLRFAALFFFLDVFVRRVVIDYRKVYRTARERVVALVTRSALQRAPVDERLAALLRKKEEVRETRAAARKFYDAGSKEEVRPPVLDPSFIAGAAKPPTPRPAPAKPPPAAPPEKGEASAAESYTGRLLEAKRRALKRPGEQPPEGKK